MYKTLYSKIKFFLFMSIQLLADQFLGKKQLQEFQEKDR